MKTKNVYLLFSSTGTMLSRTIDLYTRTSFNHVSIALDESLDQVYSFGRKRPKNPFIGGFVKENYNLPFFLHANCAIYQFKVTEYEYEKLREQLLLMEAQQDLYRYNFLGLFGVVMNKEFHRHNAFFCSQFVATLLKDCGIYQNAKPAGLTRPQDLRDWHELKLVYQGELRQYPHFQYQAEDQVIGPVRHTFGTYYYFMHYKVKRTKRRVVNTWRYFRL